MLAWLYKVWSLRYSPHEIVNGIWLLRTRTHLPISISICLLYIICHELCYTVIRKDIQYCCVFLLSVKLVNNIHAHQFLEFRKQQFSWDLYIYCFIKLFCKKKAGILLIMIYKLVLMKFGNLSVYHTYCSYSIYAI